MKFVKYLAHKKWGIWDLLEPLLLVLTAYGGYKFVGNFVFGGKVTFNLTPLGVFLFFVWLPVLLVWVWKKTR